MTWGLRSITNWNNEQWSQNTNAQIVENREDPESSIITKILGRHKGAGQEVECQVEVTQREKRKDEGDKLINKFNV